MTSFVDNDRKYTPTVKAYKNPDFLNSSQARHIRIMCEYEETMLRLKKHKIKATLLFFGSARAKCRADWETAVKDAEVEVQAAKDGEAREKAEKNLTKWKKCEWMAESTDKVQELARMLTAWAISPDCGMEDSISGVTRYHFTDPRYVKHPRKLGANLPSYSILEGPENTPGEDEIRQSVVVCTGGGPGFMEAANRGAAQVPGAKNMGMGITLPFEDGLNKYVTEELAFEFHYFFTRKFWMVYHCQALIVAPGGFGTLDELFEVLTLKQTGKIQKTLPVVLFGKDYWTSIINWQVMVDYGTIAQEDVDSLFFTDDATEAFDYLCESLVKNSKEAAKGEAVASSAMSLNEEMENWRRDQAAKEALKETETA